MIHYEIPKKWIKYDPAIISGELIEAKTAVMSLKTIPYQRIWLDRLQQIELKREVAGTSRIEGADFTERELDAAMQETPEQLNTRSQKQAHAAMSTYRWIADLPDDYPISEKLILDIHRRIVTGADDDHCGPGQIRRQNQNVNFGAPRHRGATGGSECSQVFLQFIQSLQREFCDHDPLIQAIAAHYHLAAMHPFLDGNGRTARALEAFFLQRAGLRNTSFIAMSNYYYDEKIAYLEALTQTRASNHDLTPFLRFALKGIALQCKRLLSEIQFHIKKELYRNLMFDLFHRLKTPRRRVIAERQVEILKLLLDSDGLGLEDILGKTEQHYRTLRSHRKAAIRDLNDLIALKAISAAKQPDGRYRLAIRLDWPTEITESRFYDQLRSFPKGKTHTFLS